MSGIILAYHGTAALAAANRAFVDFDSLTVNTEGGAAVVTARAVPPPQSGIVRKVILRELTVANADVGVQYSAQLFATNIMDTAADLLRFSSQAAYFIGETPVGIIRINAVTIATVLPLVNIDVEWAYRLENRAIGDSPAGGCLRAILNFSGNVTGSYGISIYVESRMPGYPLDPYDQRAGVFPGPTQWPTSV